MKAKERRFSVRKGRFPFRANGMAVIMNETAGFVKLVVDEETYEILGVHVIGPHALDLVTASAYVMASGEVCSIAV